MAKKKADEVKESLGLKKLTPEEEAQEFYSGKNPKETVQLKEEPKGDEKKVIGIIEAEKLQKAGWRLVDCHPISDSPFGDKEYKFERNK
jgi:hypothetical protein